MAIILKIVFFRLFDVFVDKIFPNLPIFQKAKKSYVKHRKHKKT
jgi:hypothetical protein